MSKDSRLNHMQHYLAAADETCDELLDEGGMTAEDTAVLLAVLTHIAAAKATIAQASIYSPIVGAR